MIPGHVIGIEVGPICSAVKDTIISTWWVHLMLVADWSMIRK